MNTLSISVTGCSIVFAALAFQPAQAQSETHKVMTRDELRVCMNSEQDLATRQKSLEARDKQSGELAVALRADGEKLADEQKRLEGSDRPREGFDRRMRAYNLRVASAQTGAESFAADLEAYKKALATHNGQCGGVAFNAVDKAAILKEREAQAK